MKEKLRNTEFAIVEESIHKKTIRYNYKILKRISQSKISPFIGPLQTWSPFCL